MGAATVQQQLADSASAAAAAASPLGAKKGESEVIKQLLVMVLSFRNLSHGYILGLMVPLFISSDAI